mmetsp:Transcript_126428/g.393478  ORF Transcript_126428/g.393478 Transcript_126428/m.393478 type:complete len:268 (+) Transcript_126428:282-1085(+)
MPYSALLQCHRGLDHILHWAHPLCYAVWSFAMERLCCRIHLPGVRPLCGPASRKASEHHRQQDGPLQQVARRRFLVPGCRDPRSQHAVAIWLRGARRQALALPSALRGGVLGPAGAAAEQRPGGLWRLPSRDVGRILFGVAICVCHHLQRGCVKRKGGVYYGRAAVHRPLDFPCACDHIAKYAHWSYCFPCSRLAFAIGRLGMGAGGKPDLLLAGRWDGMLDCAWVLWEEVHRLRLHSHDRLGHQLRDVSPCRLRCLSSPRLPRSGA